MQWNESVKREVWFFLSACALSAGIWAVWFRLRWSGKQPLRQPVLKPAGWGPIVGGLCVLAFFATQLVAGQVMVRLVDVRDGSDVQDLIAADPALFLVVQLAAYLVAGAYAVFLAAQYVRQGAVSSLGLRCGGKGSLARDALYGLVSCMMFLPLLQLLAASVVYLSGRLNLKVSPQDVVEALHDMRGDPSFWFLVVQAVVLAPLFEEVVFRGAFYQGLRRHLKPWAAACISAAVFAAVHDTMYAAVPLFVLGLVLCYLFERTGRLVASVTLHAAFNAMMVVISVVGGSGSVQGV